MKKIKSYPQAVFFSSVAEVSDIMNMEEMLSTRRAHEDLTTEVGKYLNKEGYETYILSTESCDICEKCAYKEESHADILIGCIHVWKVMV